MERSQEIRSKHNKDILTRMKNGDQLQHNATLTWYPNRPIIKKNSEHVKQLYGEDVVVIGEKKQATLCVLPSSDQCDKI